MGCCNLHTATNGEEALAVLKTVSIDLLMTDVRMPIMDGITLVRHLGEMGGPVPSIVFISGFGNSIDHREMYALGVEAFLAKPILQDDLIEIAERALIEQSNRWLIPTGAAPRRSMFFQVEGIGEMKGKNTILLGRGGFSIHIPDSVPMGKIAFRCGFTSEEREMAGQGYVHWYSKSDQVAGIEFVFLDATCHSWVVDEIAGIGPRSFIPSL